MSEAFLCANELNTLRNWVKEAETLLSSEDRLDRAEKRFGEQLQLLLRAVRNFCQTAPLPNSIFVGNGDRKEMFRAFCGFLPSINGILTELGGILTDVGEIEGMLTEAERDYLDGLLQGERLFKSSLDTEVKKEILRCIARGKELRQRRLLLRERAASLRKCLWHMRIEVYTGFAQRANELTDLGNNGENCDPRGLLRLCGELCSEIETYLVGKGGL